MCRRGCDAPETLNHIVQQCYSTHYHRIKRHNSLVQYLNRVLTSRNFTVHTEPTFIVNRVKLKPDLVIYSEERVIVIDVQIVNDQYSLLKAHNNKVEKYECLRPQLQGLRPGGLHVGSLTVNWRGVVAERSYNELMALRLLKNADYSFLASRAQQLPTHDCLRTRQDERPG